MAAEDLVLALADAQGGTAKEKRKAYQMLEGLGWDGRKLQGVKGLTIHHTGGRGDPAGVINTLNQRGLGVQYIMARDGTVYQTGPEGARYSHMRNSPKGFNNSNTIGIEVIAKDDSDVTPEQQRAALEWISAMQGMYPDIGQNVYGHGELNAHKQATEGMAIVKMFRDGGMPPEQAAEAAANVMAQGGQMPKASPPQTPSSVERAASSGAMAGGISMPTMAGDSGRGSSAKGQAARALQQAANSMASGNDNLEVGIGPRPTPQIEEAQQQAIVQANQGVNPISFAQGGVSSPDQNQRLREAAMAMAEKGSGVPRIRHPLQGVAQMANAGLGAVGQVVADRRDNAYKSELAAALMAARGGDLNALNNLEPKLAQGMWENQQTLQREQEAAAAAQARQDAIRAEDRQWANQDDERDFTQQQEIARLNASLRERPEQWEQVTLPDGRQVQRNTVTGKIAGLGDGQQINVNTGEVGKDSRKYMLDWGQAIQNAPRELQSITSAREALNAGIISGAGADMRLGLAKIGSLIGITDPEVIANTETFSAAAADGVLQLADRLKGALTENERSFLEKAAGGSIELNAESIGRVLDIRENIVRSSVDRFNTAFDQIAPNDRDLQLLAPALRVSLPDREEPAIQPGQQTVPSTGMVTPNDRVNDQFQQFEPPATERQTPRGTRAIAPPEVGEIQAGPDGRRYRFRGNDPANIDNWEPIQ